MNMVLVTERFTLQNLHSILDELGWGFSDDDTKEDGKALPDTKAQCVKCIAADIHEQGMPDGKLSDELFDLLIALGFMDEDGNEIEQKGGTAAQDDELPDKLPQCWGYADPDNIACKRCSIMVACYKLREQTRPICYGKTFSSKSPECSICLEWKYCQAALIG